MVTRHSAVSLIIWHHVRGFVVVYFCDRYHLHGFILQISVTDIFSFMPGGVKIVLEEISRYARYWLCYSVFGYTSQILANMVGKLL